MTVHLAVTSGIPLPVCGETLRGSFTSLHRNSKMAHPVLGARVRFREDSRFSDVLSRSPRRLNIGFDDPRRRFASVRGMTRDRSLRGPIGDSFKNKKRGVAKRPCAIRDPYQWHSRMTNRHWTTRPRRRKPRPDISRTIIQFDRFLILDPQDPLIHDTLTLLRLLEPHVSDRFLHVDISQIVRVIVPRMFRRDFRSRFLAKVSRVGPRRSLQKRNGARDRAAPANRSFPRPSRRSALRGLESAAARVHGAHRYRRR